MKKLILTILFAPLLALGAQTAQNVLSNAVSWGYGSLSQGDLMSAAAYAWMAPVGAGSAQVSLSNAMVNGYGALSPGDLQTVIAYGAANGSGSSSISNNPATTNGTAALITFIQQNSIGGTGATNINVSGVLSGGSGVTTTIPAGFSAAGSNYMAQVAATVTNGFHWGALYDAAGAGTAAANAATNGYVWGSLYDSAGSATAAANQATNGYPWGTLYDHAGAANAAQAAAVYAAGQAASIIAAQAAQAVTNGYPWGTGATASANSFTTNFTLTAYPTNIAISLPMSAANYIVEEKVYAVAVNSGDTHVPAGTMIDSKYISGGNSSYYFVPPLSETPSGNSFIFSYDGDYVSFSDQSGQINSWSPSSFVQKFTITCLYTWTVHK